ncbi:LuxR C-terminal-related transcriptional regulator [Streptomyces acidiscabies]|uniref:LuxR C-terminal-related transcriptional regulator n=1 Tax=Streptomyces acidiscabies TaxID=42234 RepID=A0ABU4MCJ8_9ACTN|nr:LuxR C-terminal-related transcriptional regulator [Streptomyces acidiscabies]MDX3024937.1 LuxR C-terminal-related transcriptional regulator [Streptomyces acidiscabies]
MPVTIPSAAALTQLTPAEKRVAQQLVTGVSNTEGARNVNMSISTFSGHLASIGRKFHIESRTGRPARAHAVLASQQVAPPPAPSDVPDFTPEELRLLRAIALHPDTSGLARSAGIAPPDVRAQVAALVARTGADNATQLVGWGHAWRLLPGNESGAGTRDARDDSPPRPHP